MRALIFADRIGAELEPLTGKLAVPLLPVAGKELLVYTIEDLVHAGVRDLVVVASAHGEQASVSILGDGQRWGATIRYVLSRGEEAPSAVWPRLSLGDVEAVLVLRGDVLRSPLTTEFLEQAQSESGTSAFCGVKDDPRGSLVLVRPGCPDAGDLLDSLRWNDPKTPPDETGRAGVAADLACLEDLRAYHRANLDLLAGRFKGLEVSGRSVALGLSAGRKSMVSPKSLKQGVAYVGANSRVHPDAELLGEVVIGDNVVVDRGATIRDSVILPQTYVGELVEVGNAIVSGDHLIRVDSGAVLKISEAFLLGNLGARQGRARMSQWDRITGLLLLLLSLPLWPIAVAAAALSHDGKLLTSRELVGNRASPTGHGASSNGFMARQWNTKIPILRNLPRLLAVVQGDLRLVGVSPLKHEESMARTEDWQMVRDQAPVGLLGPTQLNLTEDAPLEERLLSDAFYAQEQSWTKDMRYLLSGLRTLFSGESWRRSN
jgi:mannose-1-phosphate guanylyltransferase/phosphomannomutase